MIKKKNTEICTKNVHNLEPLKYVLLIKFKKKHYNTNNNDFFHMNFFLKKQLTKNLILFGFCVCYNFS